MFRALKSSTPKVYDYSEWVTNQDLCDLYQNCEFAVIPTLQMAMKWLRENHNIYATSVPNGIGEYVFYPQIYKKFEWGWNVLESLNGFQNAEFISPEEAIEEGIKYCLENLI